MNVEKMMENYDNFIDRMIDEMYSEDDDAHMFPLHDGYEFDGYIPINCEMIRL